MTASVPAKGAPQCCTTAAKPTASSSASTPSSADSRYEHLRPAGHRSAYYWCEKEAEFHGMSGVDVFRHYMRRITQRGWGQFDVLDVSPEAGTATVRLRNSAMVDGERRNSGRKVCYMFASWLEGSLEYVAASAGREVRLRAQEVYCEAEGAHDHCLFKVEPA
jgi:predicted hydrocarbon binding protein